MNDIDHNMEVKEGYKKLAQISTDYMNNFKHGTGWRHVRFMGVAS